MKINNIKYWEQKIGAHYVKRNFSYIYLFDNKSLQKPGKRFENHIEYKG